MVPKVLEPMKFYRILNMIPISSNAPGDLKFTVLFAINDSFDVLELFWWNSASSFYKREKASIYIIRKIVFIRQNI